MIAQRFTDLYDGILAVAPAINIENFIPAGYWATQVMQSIGYYPPPCEIDAFTQEAIAACDALDGVQDGIIGNSHMCNFTAQDVVGKSFTCGNATLRLTAEGATIVQAAWTGPQTPSGKYGWFELSKDASLTSTYSETQCLAGSTADCTGAPANLTSSWIRYFLARDANWDPSTMTNEAYYGYLRYSEQNYVSVLSASSPDLDSCKAAGGKMTTWHGQADEAIPIDGNIAYYQQILELDPDATDYYRFFTAPGVGHCVGGRKSIPDGAFDALVQWVESGVRPETLTAVSQDRTSTSRPLCPYPSMQEYVAGNASSSEFQCVDAVGKEGRQLIKQCNL